MITHDCKFDGEITLCDVCEMEVARAMFAMNMRFAMNA